MLPAHPSDSVLHFYKSEVGQSVQRLYLSQYLQHYDTAL